MLLEIVGDAAGEHAEALELLRFLQLALELLAFGGGAFAFRDVAQRVQETSVGEAFHAHLPGKVEPSRRR